MFCQVAEGESDFRAPLESSLVEREKDYLFRYRMRKRERKRERERERERQREKEHSHPKLPTLHLSSKLI